MKRLLTVIAGLVVLGVLGFFALAWWPAIAPISPSPPGSFAPDLVAHGEALAGGGFCAVCHTAKGGQTYAGGYPMQTPFGIIYSTNITPDPETGIGTWSEAAFTRAMHEGVARDGSHLFPAFPYDHFTKLSDDDVKALYAYFMTRPPVRSPAKANTIPFPLNIRYLQAGWKLLFFRPGRYEPDAAKSAEWNRGAYLALGLSHCGACHTPRNLLGARKGRRRLCRRGGRQLDRAGADSREPLSCAVDSRRSCKAICATALAFCMGSRRGRCLPFRMVFPPFPNRTCAPSRPTLPTSTMRRTARRPSMRRWRGQCPMRLSARGRISTRTRASTPPPARHATTTRADAARGAAGPRAQQRGIPARSNQPDPGRAARHQRSGRDSRAS